MHKDFLINLEKTRDYNVRNFTNYLVRKGKLTKDESFYLFEKFHEDKNKGVADELNLYRTILIDAFYGVIGYTIKRYFPLLNGEDYQQIGLIGLIRGIDTFDTSTGFEPVTYLSKCVFTSIGCALRKENRTIKPCSLEDKVYTNDDSITISECVLDPDDFREEITLDEKFKNFIKQLKHFSIQDQRIFILVGNILGTNFTQNDVAVICDCTQSYVSRRSKMVYHGLKLIENPELVQTREEAIYLYRLQHTINPFILDDIQWIEKMRGIKTSRQKGIL